jgi:hypothetical protein
LTFIFAGLLLAMLVVARQAALQACPLCRLGTASVVGTYAAQSEFLPFQGKFSTTQPASRPAGPLAASIAAGESGGVDDSTPAAAQRLPLGVQLTGGTDVTSAYYHRGFLMSDGGVITQPYLSISRPFIASGISLTPYVGTWMDIQRGGTRTSGQRNGTASAGSGTGSMFCCPGSSSGGGGGSGPWITPPDVPVAAGGTPVIFGGGGSTPAASGGSDSNDNHYALYEADIDAGVALNAGPLSLDFKYTAYTYPGGALYGFQEVGARLSFDATCLWLTPQQRQSFMLRPFIEVEREVQGANTGQYTYVETGIEPSLTTWLGRVPVGISLPITVGLSANGVYESSDGANHGLGYESAALKLTVPLPVRESLGQWYFSISATYLHLDANNLEELNGGRKNEVVAAAGIGFRL